MPDDDVKADSASLFRPAESVYVVFKAAVSTENIETSVTDRSRPYPGCLCCYSIQILLTEPSYSCQEMTQHDKSRYDTCQNQKNRCLMSRHELVQWQPPGGSRLASDIEVGTDVNYFYFFFHSCW